MVQAFEHDRRDQHDRHHLSEKNYFSGQIFLFGTLFFIGIVISVILFFQLLWYQKALLHEINNHSKFEIKTALEFQQLHENQNQSPEKVHGVKNFLLNLKQVIEKTYKSLIGKTNSYISNDKIKTQAKRKRKPPRENHKWWSGESLKKCKINSLQSTVPVPVVAEDKNAEDKKIEFCNCRQPGFVCHHLAQSVTLSKRGAHYTLPANSNKDEGYCFNLPKAYPYCNPFHGDWILTRANNHVGYQFVCQCRNPGYVGNSSLYGPCETLRLCDGKWKLRKHAKPKRQVFHSGNEDDLIGRDLLPPLEDIECACPPHYVNVNNPVSHCRPIRVNEVFQKKNEQHLETMRAMVSERFSVFLPDEISSMSMSMSEMSSPSPVPLRNLGIIDPCSICMLTGKRVNGKMVKSSSAGGGFFCRALDNGCVPLRRNPKGGRILPGPMYPDAVVSIKNYTVMFLENGHLFRPLIIRFAGVDQSDELLESLHGNAKSKLTYSGAHYELFLDVEHEVLFPGHFSSFYPILQVPRTKYDFEKDYRNISTGVESGEDTTISQLNVLEKSSLGQGQYRLSSNGPNYVGWRKRTRLMVKRLLSKNINSDRNDDSNLCECFNPLLLFASHCLKRYAARLKKISEKQEDRKIEKTNQATVADKIKEDRKENEEEEFTGNELIDSLSKQYMMWFKNSIMEIKYEGDDSFSVRKAKIVLGDKMHGVLDSVVMNNFAFSLRNDIASTLSARAAEFFYISRNSDRAERVSELELDPHLKTFINDGDLGYIEVRIWQSDVQKWGEWVKSYQDYFDTQMFTSPEDYDEDKIG